MFIVDKKLYEYDHITYKIENPTSNYVDDSNCIELCGWLVSNEQVKLFISIDNGENLPLEDNVVRPDVVRYAKQYLNYAVSFTYGFKHVVNCKFNISISISDLNGQNIKPIYVLSKSTTAQVLFGKDGFLFLQNDTNLSIAQFTGQLNIKDSLLRDWYNYHLKIDLCSKKYNFSYVFLIAPAKEEIFPEKYPFKRGSDNLIDRYINTFKGVLDLPIIYPLGVLRENKYHTYYETDTHWSDYGGYIAALEILKHFNLKEYSSRIKNLFSIKKVAGDLGSKCIPNFYSNRITVDDKFMLRNYHNGVTNVGEIRIFESQCFEIDEVLIIFGDSFSTYLDHFFKGIFRKVIFIHSVASLDSKILEFEKPKYVIFQTNQRFLTSCPQEVDVFEKISAKVRQMKGSEVDVLTKNMKSDGLEHKYYNEKMLSIFQQGAKL